MAKAILREIIYAIPMQNAGSDCALRIANRHSLMYVELYFGDNVEPTYEAVVDKESAAVMFEDLLKE